MRRVESDQSNQTKLEFLGTVTVVLLVILKATLQTSTRDFTSNDRSKYKSRPHQSSFAIYDLTPFNCPKHSFRRYLLELLWAMHKVVRIGFGNKPSLIWFLHKVFVSLLLGKVNGVVSRCKIQVCSLQIVGRRLPSHQRVLPSMSLLQYVPIHTPVMTMPVSRLRSCLCRSINSMAIDVSFGPTLP